MTCYFLLFLLPFFIALIIGNPLIVLLKSLKAKQIIREDGPSRHITEKSNTPTIGGLIFLIPLFLIILLSVLFNKQFLTTNLMVVLSTTFSLALLGFIDDYLKVVKRNNKGISGWTKLLVQLLISIIIFVLYKENRGLIFLPWVYFVMAGASNSYNITDGLDGLVGSLAFLSFAGFMVLQGQYNNLELQAFCLIFMGAILGFLYFNKYPAKVFMGDTGSLAIGGAIGGMAIVSRTELYLACFAVIPILEALSVILQVLSCQLSKKLTGVDKRIFKMAPLHHHFELCGWKEKEVVTRFFLVQAIFVIIGILLSYLLRWLLR